MADRASDHPLCKICDPPRRHSRGEPHKFGAAPEFPLEQFVTNGMTIQKAVDDALTAYKEEQRAKKRDGTRERVRRHRERKRSQ